MSQEPSIIIHCACNPILVCFIRISIYILLLCSQTLPPYRYKEIDTPEYVNRFTCVASGNKCFYLSTGSSLFDYTPGKDRFFGNYCWYHSDLVHASMLLPCVFTCRHPNNDFFIVSIESTLGADDINEVDEDVPYYIAYSSTAHSLPVILTVIDHPVLDIAVSVLSALFY
jgi:hypothetical protein